MSNLSKPTMKLGPLILDCGPGQAQTLSQFYSRLLGWNITHPAQNGTAAITSPDGSIMAFQETEHYVPPVWPWQPGKPGQMLHFDLMTSSLEDAVAFACECGAVLSEERFFDDSRTLFDPAGHTFCIDTLHE